MLKKTILYDNDSHINAALLITLLSRLILQDYEVKEDGLHCFFSQKISHLRVIIKTFLAALDEITDKQFYFEVINDQKAILKIYGGGVLRFSHDILYDPSVSPKESTSYDS
jgi:hypothetical protein